MRSTRRYEQGTGFVSPVTFVSTKKEGAVKRRALNLQIDIPLLLIVLTLLVFGLIMVFSASYDYSLTWYDDPYEIFKRQVVFMAAGLVALVFTTLLNYHWWRRLALPAMLVTIVLLMAVLFVNEVRNNAVRTLLGGSVQPSELAKLVTIIYLAVWLFSKREVLSDVSFGLLPLAGILGTVGGLIIIQPDVSAVLTILVLGGVMFFLSGGDLKQIGILLIVAGLTAWLIIQFSSTGSARLTDFLAGFDSLENASYHVRRALESFLKGGWFGVGIGRADTKLTGLPVPPTDSIFAVVGEETGVLGASGLVALYLLMLWRGLTIARRAPDDLGALLAAGLSLWISLEAFINMGVMVHLLPFAGNALPFVSAGGSNLLVSLSAIGILLNVSRTSEKTKEESGRSFNAVIDLRRWNRGRGVSRSRRSPRSTTES